ncbi:MAG: hypothetical protein A2Z34_00840 [Planctomycetes bacterium RBG_16_59_8]|nr:MAG: hypothetical protein A2Z34_00840 [Planctomycetes bacterium RBG_16_59_8]
MNEGSRALVTGANGFVGSHLVEELLKRGYRVRCLVRRTGNLRWVEALPVEMAYGDLREAKAVEDAVKGCDVIFHTAGVIKAHTLEAYLDANQRGTANIVRAASLLGANLRRFVHVSSLAACGPSRDGHPVHERTECRPVSWYGESKLRGEGEVLRYADRLPVTIVRPPVVYGPRDEGVLEFFQLAATGIVPSLDGRRYYSIIYVKDLIRGIADAAECSAAAGNVYFVANDRPVELSEILMKMAEAVGQRRRIRLHLPLALVEAVAATVETCAKIAGKTTFVNRQKVREIGQRYWVCSSEEARKDFGFRQRVALEEGLLVTAEWYRRIGRLPGGSAI